MYNIRDYVFKWLEEDDKFIMLPEGCLQEVG